MNRFIKRGLILLPLLAIATSNVFGAKVLVREKDALEADKKTAEAEVATLKAASQGRPKGVTDAPIDFDSAKAGVTAAIKSLEDKIKTLVGDDFYEGRAINIASDSLLGKFDDKFTIGENIKKYNKFLDYIVYYTNYALHFGLEGYVGAIDAELKKTLEAYTKAWDEMKTVLVPVNSAKLELDDAKNLKTEAERVFNESVSTFAGTLLKKTTLKGLSDLIDEFEAKFKDAETKYDDLGVDKIRAAIASNNMRPVDATGMMDKKAAVDAAKAEAVIKEAVFEDALKVVAEVPFAIYQAGQSEPDQGKKDASYGFVKNISGSEDWKSIRDNVVNAIWELEGIPEGLKAAGSKTWVDIAKLSDVADKKEKAIADLKAYLKPPKTPAETAGEELEKIVLAVADNEYKKDGNKKDKGKALRDAWKTAVTLVDFDAKKAALVVLFESEDGKAAFQGADEIKGHLEKIEAGQSGKLDAFIGKANPAIGELATALKVVVGIKAGTEKTVEAEYEEFKEKYKMTFGKDLSDAEVKALKAAVEASGKEVGLAAQRRALKKAFSDNQVTFTVKDGSVVYTEIGDIPGLLKLLTDEIK